MMVEGKLGRLCRPRSLALAALLAIGAAVPAQSQGQTHEISVTVERIRTTDKLDKNTPPDFYAVVTIANGKQQRTKIVRQSNDIAPNWTISERVPPGQHNINIAVYDKDLLSRGDLVDINRVDGKRDLDLSINTRTCEISNISGGYGCGDRITRQGREPKNAEVTFRVRVQR